MKYASGRGPRGERGLLVTMKKRVKERDEEKRRVKRRREERRMNERRRNLRGPRVRRIQRHGCMANRMPLPISRGRNWLPRRLDGQPYRRYRVVLEKIEEKVDSKERE